MMANLMRFFLTCKKTIKLVGHIPQQILQKRKKYKSLTQTMATKNKIAI
jgi:hypothetical protein